MINCPVCFTETNTKYKDTPYWVCPSCDLWFQNPLPIKRYEGTHELDSQGHTIGHLMSDHEKQVNKNLADWLSSYIKLENHKALDIGSKYPYLSYCLKNRGIDAYGMDNITVVPEYSKSLGVPLLQQDFESWEPGIEHIGAYKLITLVPLLIWHAAGVAAANAGLIVLVQRARLRHAHLWSFQVVCLTIPFILKTLWPHDFVFLPVTQAFLAWRLLEDQPASPGTDVGVSRPRDGARRAPTPRARIAVTAALVLSAILSNVFFYGLVARFVLYGQLAFLFWAKLLLLVGCYVMLLSEAWSSPASVRSNLEGEAS